MLSGAPKKLLVELEREVVRERRLEVAAREREAKAEMRLAIKKASVRAAPVLPPKRKAESRIEAKREPQRRRFSGAAAPSAPLPAVAPASLLSLDAFDAVLPTSANPNGPAVSTATVQLHSYGDFVAESPDVFSADFDYDMGDQTE